MITSKLPLKYVGENRIAYCAEEYKRTVRTCPSEYVPDVTLNVTVPPVIVAILKLALFGFNAIVEPLP